jgi:glycosyltransferase involved in cell wall biosynthesis
MSAMDGVFAHALRLISEGRHEAALLMLRTARDGGRVAPELLPSLDFNIALCERHLLRSAPQAAGRTLSVGIVAPADRSKGLFRDAETIAWALAEAADLRCSALMVSDNLYRHDYGHPATREYEVIDPAAPHLPGPRLSPARWLDGVDVLILLEALNPSLLALAQGVPRVRQVLFMPNLEWAVLDHRLEDTRPWEDALRQAATQVLTIARSPSIERRLQPLGVPTVLLPWSIPDPVVRPQRPPPDSGRPLNLLFNGGNLGFRDRRGLDIVVDALQRLGEPPRPVKMVIKCNKPRDELAALASRPGLEIEVDTRFVPDRDELLAYYDRADLVLYPSRFEGLGLSLLEALHRGCYVLATDGDPMSDLLPPGCLRIAAQRHGLIKLAPVFEPDPQSLAELIRQLLLEPAALVLDIADDCRERQRRFRRELAALVRLVAR